MNRGNFLLLLAAYVILSPILLPYILWKFIRHLFRLRIATKLEIPCPNCGEAIFLVGIWKCKCGYTYRGHILTECEICHAIPQFVRCRRCDVTRRLR